MKALDTIDKEILKKLQENARIPLKDLSAEVFLTTDWSNLNTESYYVVTAGTYGTEGEANANLAAVQSFCSDAYVKYSGNYQGV